MATDASPKSDRRSLCRCHCRACGFCFVGITAFDAHRIGDHEAPTLSFEGRRCVDPTRRPDEFHSRPGVCTISDPDHERGTTLYSWGEKFDPSVLDG